MPGLCYNTCSGHLCTLFYSAVNHGAIGLFLDRGTDAFFRDIKIFFKERKLVTHPIDYLC